MTKQIEKTDSLPVINITERNLPALSKQAWEAVTLANSPLRIFKFADSLVRLRKKNKGQVSIDVLDSKKWRYELARCAHFVLVRNKKAFLDLPPGYLVDDMLAEPAPPLPTLSQIISSPVFAEDGTLHTEEGYHPSTQCYLTLDEGADFSNKVPQNPSVEDIGWALGLVNELLHDFPFVSPAEKAHSISLFLCHFVRKMIRGPVPLHVIEATAPGTGKTLLAQVLTYPAIGQPLEAMSEGRSDEEMRKRLTAKLMRGSTHILIDNVRDRIASSAFAAAITAPVWEDRRLGVSQTVRIPINCIWIITGNNPSLSSEMARRSVRIRLDTGREQPWLRDPDGFRHPNLVKWVHRYRSQLIRAGLIMIQNWIAHGKPRPQERRTLGMFEDWCNVMGGILEVNGIEGFLENLESMYTASDMETSIWRSFTEAWWAAHESLPVGVVELYHIVMTREIPIDLGNGTDRSQKIRLGLQISRMRHRQFGEYRIIPGSQKNHAQLWQLEKIV